MEKVRELKLEEMKQVNGGGFIAGILVGLAAAAVYDIAANHEQFVAGFKKGAEL